MAKHEPHSSNSSISKSNDNPTVRGSFSLPESEHEEMLNFLKKRQGKGKLIGKSELIRVCFHKAKRLTRKEILDVLDELGRRTPGRPPKVTPPTSDHRKERAIPSQEYKDINDKQWKQLEILFENPIKRKKSRSEEFAINLRNILNGIFYVLKLKLRWQDVPRRYTSPATANRAFNRWLDDGLWQKICENFYLTLQDSEKEAWQPILALTLLESNRFRRRRKSKTKN